MDINNCFTSGFQFGTKYVLSSYLSMLVCTNILKTNGYNFQTQCLQGHAYVDGECIPCDVGTIANNEGCENCPNGKSSYVFSGECYTCSLGKTSDGSACEDCVAGKYASTYGGCSDSSIYTPWRCLYDVSSCASYSVQSCYYGNSIDEATELECKTFAEMLGPDYTFTVYQYPTDWAGNPCPTNGDYCADVRAAP